MSEPASFDLALLLDRYRRDPSFAVHQIRTQPPEASHAFLSAAIRLLHERDSPQAEGLARLLLETGLFVPLLCRTTLCSVAEAISIAVWVRRFAPMLDTYFAQWLAAQADHSEVDEGVALRCLAILTEINDGGRNLPALIRLLRSPNDRVRSQVAATLGRHTASFAWFLDLLRNDDPRIAANAIEGAWQNDWPGMIEIFVEGMSSPHPRVACNSLVGLYRKGEESLALQVLQRLAGQPDPRMRAASAWAMGETGSPFAMQPLRILARDETANVRRNAIRALARIRKRLAPAAPPSVPTLADAPAIPRPS